MITKEKAQETKTDKIRCVEILNRLVNKISHLSRNEQMIMISGYVAGLNTAGILSDDEATKLDDYYKTIVYAPPVIQPLTFARCCNDSTYKCERVINGMAYAVHKGFNEIIFADIDDYSKIYAVMSEDFYNEVETHYV